MVESRASKKKCIFITERSKIAKYLCDLCSAQHKFNNEMNSRQLAHSLVTGQPPRRQLYPDVCEKMKLRATCLPPDESIMQYAAECRAQSARLKSFISETPQDDSGLTTPRGESLTKLCDDVAARIEARFKQQSLNEQRWSSGSSHICIVPLYTFNMRSGVFGC